MAVLAHLSSVDAAKSPSIVARRVASLSRRRDAAVSCRALEGPRPLSICREAEQSRAEQRRATIQSSMADINCFQDDSLHTNHPLYIAVPIP